jgi:hypothetical protein
MLKEIIDIDVKKGKITANRRAQVRLNRGLRS